MNANYNVVIESIDISGNGIARINGKTIFIPGVLPEEEVKIEIRQRKKNFDIGRVVEMITPSSNRVTPKCKSFGICGGCSLQHLEFKSQVISKEKVLVDNLKHIGKVEASTILPALYGKPWEYRYRSRLSVKYVAKKGTVLVGFREKGAPLVVDMDECPILPQEISKQIPQLKKMLTQLSIKDKIPQIEVAYSKKVSILVFRILDDLTSQDTLILKHFVATANNNSPFSQLQIWLQPGGPETMYQFYPEANTNHLSYTLPKFDITMPFLPSEFTQVNHDLNQEMVTLAIELLALSPEDKVLDFFCGIGNFTLALAKKSAYALGIEGSPQLVERAIHNSTLNKLEHKTAFRVMNLFNLDSATLTLLGNFSKWLIDPPRDGAMALVSAITPTNAPQKIVYVSCNPATLARDSNILVNTHGYKLTKTGVMNMFPHTSHIEAIAVFELITTVNT